jgi:hypothetical protein
MRDNVLRGLFLQKLYEHRRETQDMSYGLSPADFSFPITQQELVRIGLQLQEHNLAQSCNDACLAWRLTARGVDIVEREGVGAPIEIKIINVSNSSHVVVGNNNTQNIDNSIQVILSAIDKAPASAEQKTEAKNLLQQFLKHPLVTSIAGGATQALLKTVLPGHQ